MGYSTFICYRRADSEAIAGRIYNRLEKQLGGDKVYMDTKSLIDGGSFPDRHKTIIKDAKVLLVIIGPQWLTIEEAPSATGARPRCRLFAPGDFVRAEIETALSAGTAIIPILVNGAERPDSGQLPKTIQKLSKRIALTVRSDTERNFDDDMESVVKQVRYVIARRSGGCLAPMIAALVVLAVIALGVYQQYNSTNGLFPMIAAQTPALPTPTPLPPPPTASYTYSESGFWWGCAINFDAFATSYDGDLDYSWDFGDGSTYDAGSSAQMSHSYTSTGTYTVTLTVTDQGARSTHVTESVYSADTWNCY